MQARNPLRDAYSGYENNHFLSEIDPDEYTMNTIIQKYKGTDSDDNKSLIDKFDVLLTFQSNTDVKKDKVILSKYFVTITEKSI